MSKVRHVFVVVHRYAGLFMAFFLLIAGITGTAIAFYYELDRALNPELYLIVERNQPALNADQLAAAVKKAYPRAFINLMMLDSKPGQSVRIRLTALKDPATGNAYPLKFTEIFVDPFDGRVLGGRERGVFHADRAHFMPFLYKVHYTLYVPGYWGEWFMGIVALVWMFDCFVGFFLTLPLKATLSKSWWQRWRPAWQIKRGASAIRFNFDLHRAGGLWAWIVLFVLALSSVYFNLTNEVFRPVLSWFSPVSPLSSDVLKPLPQAQAPVSISFEQAIQKGRTLLSEPARGMVPSYIGLTTDAPGIYRVRYADPNRGDVSWHFHYELLYLDGATGELAFRNGHYAGTAADKFILWQYPLHSGQLLGFWGRVFMGFMGLLVGALSVTGVIIWLRKRRSETLRAARAAQIGLDHAAAAGSS